MSGRARVALKSNRGRWMLVDHAILDGAGVLTVLRGKSVMSWPMSEVAKVEWLECDLEQVAA